MTLTAATIPGCPDIRAFYAGRVVTTLAEAATAAVPAGRIGTIAQELDDPTTTPDPRVEVVFSSADFGDWDGSTITATYRVSQLNPVNLTRAGAVRAQLHAERAAAG